MLIHKQTEKDNEIRKQKTKDKTHDQNPPSNEIRNQRANEFLGNK